jgi:uncharacterized membrane protein
MKNKLLLLGLLALLTGLQTACYYDNEEDLYGAGGGGNCDTTNVSFSADVQPVINANCVSCHAPGGQQESTPLTNYNEIKTYADNGKLVGRTQNSSLPMPPTGLMTQCNQDIIEAWVNAGAPNN